MANIADYMFAIIAGTFTALFSLPILYNLHILNVWVAVFAFIFAPVVFVFGVWLGKFLGRWLTFFTQFGKFAVVGFLNASIDFGTLNLLSALTSTSSGFLVGGINIPGFLMAAANSYFWNKFWVFGDSGDNIFADLPRFSLIIISGALLNSGLVIFLTTYVEPPSIATSNQWLNISKAFASAVMLAWNFLGYKYFAFNKQNNAGILS